MAPRWRLRFVRSVMIMTRAFVAGLMTASTAFVLFQIVVRKRIFSSKTDRVDSSSSSTSFDSSSDVNSKSNFTKRSSGNEKSPRFLWESSPKGKEADAVDRNLRGEKMIVDQEGRPDDSSFPGQSSSRSSGAFHHIKKPQVSQDEQLNFLASMTFANGGLRAPSCPCCV